MVQSSDQGHGRASKDGHARTAVPATRGSRPAATGRPRRVHVCMNLSPWCSITHSCAPWLLLIDSLGACGVGTRVARAGAAGRTRHMPAVGAALFIRRWTATPERVWCAPKSLPQPQPLQLSLQSTRSKLLLRGLDWIALIIWALHLVLQFGCRAEKVNFWCRVGDADNLVKVSCNRRFGYKQCLEIEPSDT